MTIVFLAWELNVIVKGFGYIIHYSKRKSVPHSSTIARSPIKSGKQDRAIDRKSRGIIYDILLALWRSIQNACFDCIHIYAHFSFAGCRLYGLNVCTSDTRFVLPRFIIIAYFFLSSFFLLRLCFNYYKNCIIVYIF